MHTNYTPLRALYAFYDDFIKGIPFACRSGCNVCCTVNVAVTSLEAALVADSLTQHGTASPADIPSDIIKQAASSPGYTPTTTINRNTWELIRGQDATEDSGEHSDGICPLLDSEGLCTVYEARPFACRAMSSTTPCDKGGSAAMEPFLVTVNLAMYQIIEHLDSQGGTTGNLSVMLQTMLDAAPGDTENTMPPSSLRNCTLPGFVVPPEEKLRFKSFLRRLQAWETEDGTPLSRWLPEELPVY